MGRKWSESLNQRMNTFGCGSWTADMIKVNLSKGKVMLKCIWLIIKKQGILSFCCTECTLFNHFCTVWPWLNDNRMNFGIFCKRLTNSKICLCTMINSSSLLLLSIVQGGV